jgi:aromatic-L-amino-acid decarboxylase
MITATIGAQCMSWQTSPAATELEQAVMEWLRKACALPPEMTGVIHDTASTATLSALIAARERATGFATSRLGAAAEAAPRLTVYASAEAHSSVAKAVRLCGIGLEGLRTIGVDGAFAMDAAELDDAMAGDVEDGFVPCAVVATAGTTSSTAIDPLAAVAGTCRRHGAWMHVDAAYAGAAMILPEKRGLFSGIESADSVVVNPHKWLLTNFDCTAFFVRDARHLVATFGADPEYLRTAHDGEVANLRDWGIPLGRRFRALKLWFVMRMYGLEGLREVLRGHLAMAQELRARVEAAPGFEVMAPSPFGLVCFRLNPGGADEQVDALNARILAAVNATGRVHLTHTRLDGRYALRMSIGQRTTTRAHVEEAWRIVREAAREAAT